MGLQEEWAHQVTLVVPADAGDMRLGPHPQSGISLEKGMQPTPVFVPRESPGTEGASGLQSMGSQRVGHD